jgi:hypothetical protein
LIFVLAILFVLTAYIIVYFPPKSTAFANATASKEVTIQKGGIYQVEINGVYSYNYMYSGVFPSSSKGVITYCGDGHSSVQIYFYTGDTIMLGDTQFRIKSFDDNSVTLEVV